MAVRYSLESQPQGRIDGSRYVDHNLMAQDDVSGDWEYVPGYHKTFCVPADEIATIMAMPDGTAQERQAKNTAYKDLLAEYASYIPSPLLSPSVVGWTEEDIEQYRSDYTAWQTSFNSNNVASYQAANSVNEYITVTLGQDYPVGFKLNVQV